MHTTTYISSKLEKMNKDNEKKSVNKNTINEKRANGKSPVGKLWNGLWFSYWPWVSSDDWNKKLCKNFSILVVLFVSSSILNELCHFDREINVTFHQNWTNIREHKMWSDAVSAIWRLICSSCWQYCCHIYHIIPLYLICNLWHSRFSTLTFFFYSDFCRHGFFFYSDCCSRGWFSFLSLLLECTNFMLEIFSYVQLYNEYI